MNKKLIIVTAGRVLQMVIMFITYRVLSSVLSIEDMGIYYFLLSISAGFGLIFANPLGMYTNRMLHSWQENGVLVENFKKLIGIFLLGSFLTIPFLFFFEDKLSIHSQAPMIVLVTLVFYVFSSAFNSLIIPALNLLGDYSSFVTLSLLTSLIGLIASVALVQLHPSDPLYWLMGQGIGFLLFAIIAFFQLSKDSQIQTIRPLFIQDRVKRVAKFALPIALTNVAVWTLAQSFRFFFKDNVDPVELGELAFGLGLSTALSVALEYLFHQLYLPDFYKQINSHQTDRSIVWNN